MTVKRQRRAPYPLFLSLLSSADSHMRTTTTTLQFSIILMCHFRAIHAKWIGEASFPFSFSFSSSPLSLLIFILLKPNFLLAFTIVQSFIDYIFFSLSSFSRSSFFCVLCFYLWNYTYDRFCSFSFILILVNFLFKTVHNRSIHFKWLSCVRTY